MKITRHRRLLIALSAITVGMLAGVAWLVWPERQAKNLTLRLKFVGTEVVDGKSKLLFRIEGAEKYGVFIEGFRYVQGQDLARERDFYPLNENLTKGGEFYVDQPKYALFNYERCKLQAVVLVIHHESKFSHLGGVIQGTWKNRQQFPSIRAKLSLAKLLWRLNPKTARGELVITSDAITNVPPVIQFRSGDF